MFMFLMRRLPPRSTLTVTLFPYTTLFRSLPFADPPRRSFSILRNGPVATPFAARMAAHQPHRRLSLDRPRCAIVRPQAASPDARRRRSGETLAYIWVRSMYRPQSSGIPLLPPSPQDRKSTLLNTSH